MLLIFALLLTAISFSVMGELLLKAGMNQVGELSLTFDGFLRTFTEWRVILGFTFIFGGSLFWLGVISRVDFSFAYPMLALSYLVSMIPARLFLNEQITTNRVVGAMIIVVGVIVINWRGR